MPTASRIQPADPPYSAPIQANLDRIMPPGVPPLTLFRVLARDERLYERFKGASLLDRGHLTLRQRELAILRTCARCGCEYEWGVHATAFAGRAGLTPEEVVATTAETLPDGTFEASERSLIGMMDALHETATLDEGAWTSLRECFEELQLLELIMLAGFYHTVSYISNATALPLEPFGARFPTRPAGVR